MRRFPFGDQALDSVRGALAGQLENHPGVVLAYLHGSAARGADHVSDVDVAVLLDGDPPRDDALDRELELE